MEGLAILHAIVASPPNVNLRIFTDNMNMVQQLSQGMGDDSKKEKILNEIKQVSLRKQITPVLEYVNTKNNPADKPSREPNLFKKLNTADNFSSEVPEFLVSGRTLTMDEFLCFWDN